MFVYGRLLVYGKKVIFAAQLARFHTMSHTCNCDITIGLCVAVSKMKPSESGAIPNGAGTIRPNADKSS